MIITHDTLTERDACAPGLAWFDEHFPEGGEYQEVLDRAAETSQPGYAHWLMDHFGATDAVLEVDALEGRHCFFAGTVRIKDGIALTGSLRAGEGIRAGLGIKAGEGIKAGSGYGTFAGLHVRVADWPRLAIVTATTKPDNLMTGHWSAPT